MKDFDWKNPNYPAVLAERAQRLARLRADPSMLPGLKAYYREQPWQLIEDFGFTADPRNAGTEKLVLMPFILFPRQREWCEWFFERWKARQNGMTKKSRDTGMSFCAIAMACVIAVLWDGVNIGFGSEKQDKVDKLGDMDALLPKARMFLSMLPQEFRGGFIPEKHAPFMRIQIPATGSMLKGEVGDQIGRGGRTSIFIVDEAAHLVHPELADAALSANTNTRIDISSVCGAANSFAQRYMSGNWPTFSFSWMSDPRKDDEWYAKFLATWGATITAQEVDGDFNASVDGRLIESEWLQAAVDAHLKLGVTPSGVRSAAFDVADTGADQNALAGGHGILLEHVEEWSGKSSDIAASTAYVFTQCDIRGYTDLIFDGDGLGAGVRGDARKLNEGRKKPLRVTQFRGSESPLFPDRKVTGHDGKPLDRTNGDMFANRKAASWWALRNRFEHTWHAVVHGKPFNQDDIISLSSSMPKLSALLNELAQPTYSQNNAGKIVVDKQPDGVSSPNLADALMMRMAPRVVPMVINPKLLHRV